MLKILQARLQQYVNHELPFVQAGFRKGRGIRDQIANICWIIEKARESQKNIYFCFIDYAKAFNCVDHNKLWTILKEVGIPDHLTCLLRNLYAGQEATVQTGHGTTDWFQIGKGVCQGCILSPCLFDFYAEFSSVQSLSHVRIFATPWTAALQASLSISNCWSLLKLMSIELVMPSNPLIFCCPFPSCPHAFPGSGSFPVSQLFASGGQSTGVSASTSVLPMNTQDWSPLGWTGWISLQSKGLSRVFSNVTVQKH